MADYKSYLAANILTEDKIVTYRLLSRALKIHTNTAKESLFEFHRIQNAKKSGTIHATYLISGTKRKEAAEATNGHEKDGEDSIMQSSPFASSMPQPEDTILEESPVLTITLVREEDLDTVKSEYDHISSIFVYSLGPHPLKDLQLLSDSTREIQTICAAEDLLETYPKYGVITNPNVKRRSRKAPIPAVVPISVPSRAAPPKSKLNEVQEASKPASQSSKSELKSQPSNAKDFFGSKGKEKAKSKAKPEIKEEASSKESTPAPPANLKRESSSIFKAFAKTQPKKAKNETTDSGAETSAKEDTPMKGLSDDDDEEEDWMPQTASKKKIGQDRKSRKEIEEALKKMMEDDEEEEEAEPSPEPVEEEEEEKEEQKADEEEPTVTTSNGRRRGRRRVMKKKTVKDEDGYLVTKQEAVWESFSEDEPAPPPKAKSQSTNTAKPKKGAPKAGQGNIMSFFGKKPA
ncbi:CDC27 protein [Clarireedia jacksonii]